LYILLYVFVMFIYKYNIFHIFQDIYQNTDLMDNVDKKAPECTKMFLGFNHPYPPTRITQ